MEHPFSSTAELWLGKDSFFIKYFHDLPRFTAGNSDISPAYKRDRVSVSSWAYNVFQDHSPTRKYFPELIAALPRERILITKSIPQPNATLETVFTNRSFTRNHLLRLKSLTECFSKTPTRVSRIPAFLNNNAVLALKLNLQFQKPLALLLSPREAHLATQQLRKHLNYPSLGDLQPKNILISKNSLYLIDFEEAFVGPLGWDIGFLWGNILYSAACQKTLLAHLTDAWQRLAWKLPDPMRRNAFTISSAAIAMRLFLFPTMKLTAAQQEKLKLIARRIFNYA